MSSMIFQRADKVGFDPVLAHIRPALFVATLLGLFRVSRKHVRAGKVNTIREGWNLIRS